MSPGNDRGRLRQEPPSKSNNTTTAIVGPDRGRFDDLAAVRRRREAALRCEPLESGKRDPQFGVANDAPARSSAVLEGLRALWRLADPADRPVVERIAKRVQEGAL